MRPLTGQDQQLLRAPYPAAVHSPSFFRAGGAAPLFHGHGLPIAENKKEDLARFFRVVDHVLWEVLRDERAPLVLLGVGYYHPIYRAISRYPHLAEQGVEGNFEHATPEEIHAQVWPIVSELFQPREEAVLSEYARLNASGQVLDDLHTIAQAAIQGRVQKILVAEDAHLWGMFDRTTGELIQHAAQNDSRDDDILDDLAECVIARGGDVLLLPAVRMPSRLPVAAILRW